MDSDVLKRYNQKVRDFCGGIDPFTLSKADKHALPFKAYKTLQSFQYFENGWENYDSICDDFVLMYSHDHKEAKELPTRFLSRYMQLHGKNYSIDSDPQYNDYVDDDTVDRQMNVDNYDDPSEHADDTDNQNMNVD
ncbi:hypothetical protein Bhyg_04182 [Pseudolycoriella hygida]|uniref:Uncharacterized protein n=1 Tax=Pseudolycoriella hygida TaxID=35572 RepID=A0A9Q0S9W9_9DIPT|nr:hypothetical protein Bhyg_04182 [Pseudolycoriella hygida]